MQIKIYLQLSTSIYHYLPSLQLTIEIFSCLPAASWTLFFIEYAVWESQPTGFYLFPAEETRVSTAQNFCFFGRKLLFSRHKTNVFLAKTTHLSLILRCMPRDKYRFYFHSRTKKKMHISTSLQAKNSTSFQKKRIEK